MMVPYTDDAASGHRSVNLSRRSAEGGVDAVVVFRLELAHQDGDLLLCLVETLLKRREQGDSPLVALDALLELDLVALEGANDGRELVQTLLEAQVVNLGRRRGFLRLGLLLLLS